MAVIDPKNTELVDIPFSHREKGLKKDLNMAKLGQLLLNNRKFSVSTIYLSRWVCPLASTGYNTRHCSSCYL